jgi:CzcA family heavy metal efflux pump
LLATIVRLSLRFRGVVIALAIVAVGYGIYSLANARYDVFPEFASKQIEVQTEAAGLAPEQVELLVTRGVENAINGTEGLEALRSESVEGLSLVTAVFAESTDVYRDRQIVAERLTTISASLPAGVSAPVMTPLTSSTGDLMTIGLTSDRLDAMQLRTVADALVQQRLLAVPGIAKASVYGGQVRQIAIEIDPAKLQQHDVDVSEVVAAARRASGIRGAGFVDTGNQRIVLRAETGAIGAAEIARTVIRHEASGNLTLADVGRVTDAPAPPISGASVMGKPAVVLNLWTQYGANTVETTRAVDDALAELRPALQRQSITVWPDLFRAAKFIDTATTNIRSSLLIGAILVIVVLFLFLADFRSAAISCTAIPLSLLAAIAIMQRLGYTLNTMTLGGLAIAIGEVVDDAVIDVENIVRRLRESSSEFLGVPRVPRRRNSEEPRGTEEHRGTDVPTSRSPFAIVYAASMEVRGAVVYATLAVVLVFVPIITMSGLAGRLFGPMAIAYIIAILASLVVALTLTPALSLLLLHKRAGAEDVPRIQSRLRAAYVRILHGVEAHPFAIVGAAALITAAALALLLFLPQAFLPELHEGHYLVHLETAPGTSIDESLRIGNAITRELLEVPFIRSVAQRVGRSASDDVFGPHQSEIEIDLKPVNGAEAESAAEKLRKLLGGFPGTASAVNTFLTERIEETITGYTAPVVINIYGNDLDALDAAAGDVASTLGHIRGAADVQLRSPAGAPQLAIRFRHDALARWGLAPVDVLDSLRVAYEGETVSEVYEGSRSVDVVVILDRDLRRSLDAVGALPIRNAAGVYVPLRDVADIVQTSGRYGILHESAKRVQTVTCDVAGRDLHSFVAEARRAIAAKVVLPRDSFVQFTGAAEAQARSRRDLVVHSLVAGIAILLLLLIVLGNARNLMLVALNLPFALAGGVVALFVSRGELSVGSLVGFVTLFGITLRNSIMMLSHYEHLVAEEGCEWNLETAIRGASERLVPILMTSIVTALGLLPLALASGSPGREIEGPMAVVILGGLITSTALNLLVLPTLAFRYGRFATTTEES